jgi:hypothetical protein
MFGTGAMNYNEKQHDNRFRNSIVSTPYLEEDPNLMGNPDLFARFPLFI